MGKDNHGCFPALPSCAGKGKFLDRRRLLRCETQKKEKVFGKVALIGAVRSATTAYFLNPILSASAFAVVEIADDEVAESGEFLKDCDAIVIVRYLHPHLVGLLRQFKNSGREIIYFMDDDLMDVKILRELPRDYAKRIRRAALNMRPVIEELAEEFWVSTEYLAKKYQVWNPLVLSPSEPVSECSEQSESITVCYHGSASHGKEIEWLVDIVREVQSRTNHIHFEFFGDIHVNRKFRGIPRTSIVHPMSWGNYLRYTSIVTRQIALAPLLPSGFNAGRGATKFFDFARMRAVGIYSDVAPYKGFIQPEKDGILLPNDTETWVRCIVDLANNHERRTVLAVNARNRAIVQSQQIRNRRLIIK